MSRTHVLQTASIVSALALLVVACSNQGEGGRCDPNANNEDCQSGLICQKLEGQESPLCCPPPSRPAKDPACLPGQLPVSDAGPKDAPPGTDAPNDTKTDAPPDSDAADTNDSAIPDSEPDVASDAKSDADADTESDAIEDSPSDVESDT